MKRTILCAAMGLIAWTGVTWAGRPLITDDADPVERGKFEVEAGFGYVGESDCDHFDVPLSLTTGILPRVEAGIGFGGQFENRREDGGRTVFEEGMSDLTLGFKWKVLDQDTALLDQALAGTIKFPTADDGKGLGSGELDYDLTWILTRQITDELGVLFNIGYTWLGDADDNDVVHYGPAVTYQLTEKLQPLAEIVFETPVQDGKSSIGVNYGFRYQLLESLTIDAAAGNKVAGDWPQWTATVGLTWLF